MLTCRRRDLLNSADLRFAQRAVRRQRLFLALSVAGIAIALGLTIVYTVLWWRHPGFSIATRAVIVVLILLNARQNLRQYRYARVLSELLPGESR